MTDQGATYAGFVQEQLEQERKRREDLDARGLTVLTTTSGLVALLFAISVLVTGKDYKVAKHLSVGLVVGALVTLVIAAILGILANRLRGYAVPKIESLEDLLTGPHWEDSEATARSITSQAKLGMISSLRTTNNSKVTFLESALWAQIGGLAMLTGAIMREALRIVGIWN